MGSLNTAPFDIRKIAVIGAGPAGLSAARYLKAQGHFDTIVVYEQQAEVGGIWNYSELASGPCPAPQQDPFYRLDPPLPQENGPPVFSSAMYKELHANIPETIMRFSDQRFPPDSLLFPTRKAIQDYLIKYSEDLRELIMFCAEVKRVSLRYKDGKPVWDLEYESTLDKQVFKDSFDAVVVANGHYEVPFIPDMRGMKEFSQAYPSSITHSKTYRTEDPFRDRKTIVIGNGPSGVDIARQINDVSKGKTLISVRTATPPAKLAHMGCEEVAEIDEFIVNERSVRFKDGRFETDIDAVVFCTGFLYSYPFLPDMQHKLITVGKGVHGLYQHLFYIDQPTLAFPALNIKAAPWPLSEAQAAALAAVWSNNIRLPAAEAMRSWADDLYETQGETLQIFRVPLGDGNYINELHDWVQQSPQKGKEAPFWDDRMMWMRSIYAEGKMLFEQQGCQARTLEELGFRYDPSWKDKE